MILLDTSAVLAVIFEERGSEIVWQMVTRELVVSAVNYTEALLKMEQRGADMRQLTSFLLVTGLRVVPYDKLSAERAAATLRQSNITISLADRACLGTAMTLNCSVLTADKVWKDLGLALDIKLIR